jgi:GTP-binding protein
MPLKVAIIGRPNVGKSTLFNRLVGKRLAIVDDTPGVTRDRRYGDAEIAGLKFQIIDTAGLEEGRGDAMEVRMRRQTDAALEEADVALFLVDARSGIVPMDRHFADWLRRAPTPVVLVANKAEGREGMANAMEAFALGLGDPIAISAEHGEGMGELFRVLNEYVPEEEDEAGEGGEIAPPIQLAIVGRPNAGKSTLVNRLLGEDRMLTGPEPGLTRDAIAVDWDWQGNRIKLVDTAGLRRKARIDAKLEKLSVADTLRTIRLAQVVVLVIDGQLGLEKQDLTIADMVEQEGRALVIVANKWDAVDDRALTLRAIEDRVTFSLTQVRGVPVVTLSALTGRHADRLMPAVIGAYERWNRRVKTAQFNRWLGGITQRHPPPAVQGRRVRLRYGAQVKARPPTFALFVSRPLALPDSYVRYLANSLRETFDMGGVPIRIELRKNANPYVDEDD